MSSFHPLNKSSGDHSGDQIFVRGKLQPRYVRNVYYGYLCPRLTSDGDKCGMVKSRRIEEHGTFR